MATQFMQLPFEQEQQMTQTVHSPSIVCEFPVMAPRSLRRLGSRSSPGHTLYQVLNNKSSEGSHLGHGMLSPAPTKTPPPANGDVSWEIRAFAEDSASCSGQWPPRSYACNFCRREFRTAQALGGHMNVHRRERAQANDVAISRSSAQHAATAAPQVNAVRPQAPWCLYSSIGVNPATLASPERKAFFYSNLAPSEAISAMTMSSSGVSSHFISSSSPGPSTFQVNENGASENHNKAGVLELLLNSAQSLPSQFSTSPTSSPISQVFRSSSSSGLISQGGRRGGYSPHQSTSSVSGESAGLAHNVHLGPFLESSQSSAFTDEAGPLVTRELIQLRPQQYNSKIYSTSMLIRGPVDDVGFLDLELRLGPAC